MISQPFNFCHSGVPSRFILAALALFALVTSTLADKQEYMERRAEVMAQGEEMSFDAGTTLTPDEKLLDALWVERMTEYIGRGREDHSFEPVKFWYEWDHGKVQGSELWDFVRTMPKGGALHLHSGSSGSVDWVVEEGIWGEGGHVFWGGDETSRCLEQPFNIEVPCGEGGGGEVPLLKGMLAFFNTTALVPEGFKTPAQIEKEDGAGFKEELRSLLVSGESLKEMDSGQAWEFFNKIFVRVGPAMSYKGFYEGYLRNTFDVHAEDNVQHVEIRALCGNNGLGDLWDFDGRVYRGEEVIEVRRSEERGAKRQQRIIPPFYVTNNPTHARFARALLLFASLIAGLQEIVEGLSEGLGTRFHHEADCLEPQEP